MPIWEYKHITSGQHGFATPAHLEAHLNQLGRDEWEIILFQPNPANPLAFTGLARRPTTRDWTLEDAVAAAAKSEAEKIRAEFAAKFQAAQQPAEAEKPASLLAETETPKPDDIRRLRDTDRDTDPEAQDDDWDNLDNPDDDLPAFFDAIKPHLRKNLRGPGQSVALDYLAKRWQITDEDLLSALRECGFEIPETEDAPPRHLEYEGDLFWLNLNNRHQLFLNTREKPAPKFRVVKAVPLDPNDPAAQQLAEEAAAEKSAREKREQERLQREQQQAAARLQREAARQAAADNAAPAPDAPAPAAPAGQPAALPEGPALLDTLRALMRRNRRGPGISGSISFLARALHTADSALLEALAVLGIPAPEKHNQKLPDAEIAGHLYWLNRDGNGGYWLNSRYAPKPQTPQPETDAAGQPDAPPASDATPSTPPPSETTGTDATATAEEPPRQPAATDEPPPVPADNTAPPQSADNTAAPETHPDAPADAPDEEPSPSDDAPDAKPKKSPKRKK